MLQWVGAPSWVHHIHAVCSSTSWGGSVKSRDEVPLLVNAIKHEVLRTTNIPRVTTQKGEDLSYTAAEAWNLAWWRSCLRGSTPSGRMGSCYPPHAGHKMFTGDIQCSFFLAVASGGFQRCFQVSQNWRDISCYNSTTPVLDTGL
jgi:hypothetical protein